MADSQWSWLLILIRWPRRRTQQTLRVSHGRAISPTPVPSSVSLDDWGIEDVDLFAGGPPCQPFSTAGMSKIGNLVRRGGRSPIDARADLWRSFFAIVDRLNPRAMLFENVPNFAQAQGGAPLIALVNELESRGYGVHVEVVEAWRYRVPQHRSRLFVIGIAGNGRFEWPKPVGRRTTVGQAIRDLPVAEADVRDEVQVYEGPQDRFLRDYSGRA